MTLVSRILFVALTLALALQVSLGDVKAKHIENVIIKDSVGRAEIDKVKCDKIENDKFRVGDKYNLYVTLTAKNAKAKVTDVTYWFYADEDYNGTDAMPRFHPTKALEDSNGLVQNSTMKLLESEDYVIRIAPKKRSDENVIVKYEVFYNDIGANSKHQRFAECLRYAVTSCGDYVVDHEFGEECDEGPDGSAQCTKTCKKIKK